MKGSRRRKQEEAEVRLRRRAELEIKGKQGKRNQGRTMPHNYPIATIQYRSQLPQYSLNPRRAIIDPEIIGHKLFRQSQTIWKCFKIITLKHGIEAFQYYRQQFSKNILSGLPCRHGVFGVQRDCVMRTKMSWMLFSYKNTLQC